MILIQTSNDIGHLVANSEQVNLSMISLKTID